MVGVVIMSHHSISLHPGHRSRLYKPVIHETQLVLAAIINACHHHHRVVHRPGYQSMTDSEKFSGVGWGGMLPTLLPYGLSGLLFH